MELFIITGNKIYPTTECLRINEFKEIWDRDTTDEKHTALCELSYIEFMLSPKKTNPFSGYKENIKERKIIDNLFGEEEEFTPDEVVINAMTKYNEFLNEASPSLRYYKSNLKAAEKLRKFLEEVDLTERNEKGMLLYKMTDVARTLKDAGDILTSLNKLKERVEKELFENSRTKGNKEINEFEK